MRIILLLLPLLLASCATTPPGAPIWPAPGDDLCEAPPPWCPATEGAPNRLRPAGGIPFTITLRF